MLVLKSNHWQADLKTQNSEYFQHLWPELHWVSMVFWLGKSPICMTRHNSGEKTGENNCLWSFSATGFLHVAIKVVKRPGYMEIMCMTVLNVAMETFLLPYHFLSPVSNDEGITCAWGLALGNYEFQVWAGWKDFIIKYTTSNFNSVFFVYSPSGSNRTLMFIKINVWMFISSGRWRMIFFSTFSAIDQL